MMTFKKGWIILDTDSHFYGIVYIYFAMIRHLFCIVIMCWIVIATKTLILSFSGVHGEMGG